MGRLMAVFCLFLACSISPPHAQEGWARFEASEARVSAASQALDLTLQFSRGVPYRAYTLDAPRRLVLEFQRVDWHGRDFYGLSSVRPITQAGTQHVAPDWSRLVLELAAPYVLHSVDMQVPARGAAVLTVRLQSGSEDAFAKAAGAPEHPALSTPIGGDALAEATLSERPFLIMLDPGHGGQDDGATSGDILEKDLMLIFARELRALLEAEPDVEVILTRSDDSFVSLDRRVALAHAAGADLFLSLHADALLQGRAAGAVIYMLSETASDKASAALAERHNRADILAGIDLGGQDDDLANVLIDLARQQTAPRTRALAETLAGALVAADLPTSRWPIREAGFAVLKSPSVPSLMLELGFMSNPRDVENLSDPAWRQAMAQAVAQAIGSWRARDAAATRRQ